MASAVSGREGPFHQEILTTSSPIVLVLYGLIHEVLLQLISGADLTAVVIFDLEVYN